MTVNGASMKQTKGDDKMTNAMISRILDMHYIPHYEENGKIFADTMEVSEKFAQVEDVTGWSKRKLFDWLGY